MKIPSLPNIPLVGEDGNMPGEWIQYFNQLTTALQQNLGNEGYVLPQQPTSNISQLTDASKSNGAMLYDNTTNEMKVNINGTWKVVTVV